MNENRYGGQMYHKVEHVGGLTESFDAFEKAFNRYLELWMKGSHVRLYIVTEKLVLDSKEKP